MRAVMRTLTQCHARRIMHRDVKPGNFLLLNDADRSPLKAIGKPWFDSSLYLIYAYVRLSSSICWSRALLQGPAGDYGQVSFHDAKRFGPR